METLKKLEELCQPDARQRVFCRLDQNAPGVFRSRTVEDVYRAVAAVRLNDEVPEEIRSHFETARNLAVYAWFFYPFNVTAQLSAFITVEFALRLKAGDDRKTPFSRILKQAVDRGWIRDSGFTIPTRRLQRIKERNAEMPEEYREPEPILLREYADAICDSIPALRNSLAHGSTMLHDDGAGSVRIAAELINQLFPHSSLCVPAATANRPAS